MSFKEARQAIIESSEASSVYIGCDSMIIKKKGKNLIKFSCVIILHKDSKHGGRIFHTTETRINYGNMKQRLMMEAEIAIDAALQIMDIIGNRTFEIHLDLNKSSKYASNVAVKEALGWVKGATGLDAKVKPEAFAASSCADFMVRQ